MSHTCLTQVSHRRTKTPFCLTQASHKPHTPHKGHIHALAYTNFRQTSHRPHIGPTLASYIPTKPQNGHTWAPTGLNSSHTGPTHNPHIWYTQTHKGLTQLRHKPHTGPTEVSHKTHTGALQVSHRSHTCPS